MAIDVVNVSGLKNNPTDALCRARQDMAVMNRNRPDAFMVGTEKGQALDAQGVSPALATPLFRYGALSLVRSASLANQPVSVFVAHVSRLGIPVVRLNESETVRDLDTSKEWLASS